ncbi:MAG: DUF2304 domain-containing protein [Deltaproteobacteria bacterium]|nr:DUF2304 domain-containing protein [Deltaproteobacteria bacterium]
MSNLRIVGLVIGVIGLLSTFLIYRGPKWKRSNFVLFSLFSLGLIIITINPDVVNFLRDALSLQEYQYGRLIALLIISNIFLLFFSFYIKSKLENILWSAQENVGGRPQTTCSQCPRLKPGVSKC